MVEVKLGGSLLRIANIYIPPDSSCPTGYSSSFKDLRNARGDYLIYGDFNVHHPSWYSRTEDDRAAESGESLDAAVWLTELCFLNEDLRLPGLSTAPRREHSYVNFLCTDWEGFERETELLFSSLGLPLPPPPFSCAKGEKQFRKVLATAATHNIPAAYQKDFREHRIPEAVRSHIEEMDSCRMSDPTVRILNDLIQRGIRQEAKEQWQSLPDRSDRRTNPTRPRRR